MAGRSSAGSGKMTGFAARIGDRLVNAMHGIAVFLAIPALVVLISVDVVLRYGFNAPLLWGSEVSALLLLVTFCAALPRCTAEDGHIRMELLYERFPRRGRAVADLLSAGCGLTVSGFLFVQGFLSSAEMHRYGERAEMIDIAYWPFAALIGVSAGLMCLHFLGLAMQAVRRLAGGKA